MAVEMDRNFGEEARNGGAEKSSAMLLQLLAEGRDTPAARYEAAIAGIPALRAIFEEALKDNDVAITLSAKGVAPPIETTGDPVFCTAWSLLGTPSITLPLLKGEHGLPIGVQIVGRRGDDTGVLRAADWLWRKFSR
jgi:Asp-tRNA(Asn)/Glu-tRNA(Gln) amidotransferase A subunit family amidase